MENQNLEVVVFQHSEFGQLRKRMIDGNPRFAGLDIAKSLGYERAKKATTDHVYADMRDREEKIR